MPDTDQLMDSVFSQYFSRLVKLAQRQLHQSIREKVDGEDIVMSALRSFFVLKTKGTIDTDSIWGLLATMVRRKCVRQFERYASQKRDINKEISINVDPSRSVFSREPTPEMATLLKDTVLNVIQTRTIQHQKIIELHMSGLTFVDISAEVGKSERTVERVIKRLRNDLRTQMHSEN